MKITGADLSKISQYLFVLELAAKFTANSADDWLIRMLRRVGDDQDMLDSIATYLNWIPLFGSEAAAEHNDNEPTLPDCCKEFEPQLIEARGRLIA